MPQAHTPFHLMILYSFYPSLSWGKSVHWSRVSKCVLHSLTIVCIWLFSLTFPHIGEHNIIIDVSAAVDSSLLTAGVGAAGDRLRPHCGYCGIIGSTQSIFHLPLQQKGKPAKFLREKILPSLLEFLTRESRREGSTQSILVISDDPGDVSVAIALFVLSLWYNGAGKSNSSHFWS